MSGYLVRDFERHPCLHNRPRRVRYRRDRPFSRRPGLVSETAITAGRVSARARKQGEEPCGERGVGRGTERRSVMRRHRRMRRRMRRRMILVGGAVLIAAGTSAVKMSPTEVQQVEQQTGKKAEDLTEQELDTAMETLASKARSQPIRRLPSSRRKRIRTRPSDLKVEKGAGCLRSLPLHVSI